MDKNLQEALLNRLYFIESLLNLEANEMALSEVKSLIGEVEKGEEIVPF